MIKISKYTIFVFTFSILLSACKKETVGDAIEFATLNVENKSSFNINDLKLTYNSQALQKSGTDFNNIMVPPGKGSLSFTDLTNNSLLDTTFVFEPGKTVNWVLFQPSIDAKPVLLENNVSGVSQPDAEHIKVKFANFVPKAFPKPFDIIFYWMDWNTYEPVEGGRLNNITTSFPKEFTELIFKEKTNSVIMMLVDHETQAPLLDDVYSLLEVTGEQRILTLFMTENEEGGLQVTGSPYKIEIKSLFLN